MGFWALGPTMGSLAASLVATHTLTHLHPFQDQFIISGLVCIGVVVISLFFCASYPGLRDRSWCPRMNALWSRLVPTGSTRKRPRLIQ